MTVGEWNICTDPQAMFAFLRDSSKLSERKARLFAVACCRSIWHLLTDERSRNAVEVAERYADGLVSAAIRQEAAATAARAYREAGGTASAAASAYSSIDTHDAFAVIAALDAEDAAATVVAYSANEWNESAYEDGERVEEAVHCGLLRDVVGNPFREVRLAPALLTWNEGTVVKLAQAAYEERELPSGHLDRTRLAVLADALEEAGCSEAEVLGHLRGPGPCVRGCHIVDALLGKN